MELPIIDGNAFLADPTSAAAQAECAKAATALIEYGALVLKSDRVTESDNDDFLDLQEDYWAQSEAELEKDTRPQFGYQVGATLSNVEKPKCIADVACHNIISALAPSERPLDLTGHSADPKCRFFWRMGQAPPADSGLGQEYPALSAPNVVPQAFADCWEERMEKWGKQMRSSVQTVAQMVAVGLGLDKDILTEAGKYGSHLLAPTATDLSKYGRLGSLYAGFHTDLNALTIHGRSRYPGLHIWARNTGKRIAVKIPPGHLLVQAGKQIEHLTNGTILAGFHEVAATEATMAAIERRRREFPDRPVIRISSTFFWHLGSDFLLKPINLDPAQLSKLGVKADAVGQRTGEADGPRYPTMKVGEQVQMELRHIALMA